MRVCLCNERLKGISDWFDFPRMTFTWTWYFERCRFFSFSVLLPIGVKKVLLEDLKLLQRIVACSVSGISPHIFPWRPLQRCVMIWSKLYSLSSFQAGWPLRFPGSLTEAYDNDWLYSSWNMLSCDCIWAVSSDSLLAEVVFKTTSWSIVMVAGVVDVRW